MDGATLVRTPRTGPFTEELLLRSWLGSLHRTLSVQADVPEMEKTKNEQCLMYTEFPFPRQDMKVYTLAIRPLTL